MRFSAIAFTLFSAAASASASSLLARQGTLPACAMSCTASASLGGCVVSDTLCLCTNQQFVSSTTACVQSTCTGDDLVNALKFSQDLCLKVGVTLAASSTAAAASSPTKPASATGTSTGSAASATASKAAASTHGVNAVLGLAAAGFVVLAL